MLAIYDNNIYMTIMVKLLTTGHYRRKKKDEKRKNWLNSTVYNLHYNFGFSNLYITNRTIYMRSITKHVV